MKKLLVVSCIIVTITGCVKTTRELSSLLNTSSPAVKPEKTKPEKTKVDEQIVEQFGTSVVAITIGRYPRGYKSIYMLDQNKCKIFVFGHITDALLPLLHGLKENMPKENESITWSGSCVDGYGDGMGTWQRSISNKTQKKYIGKLKEGKAYGKGTLIWYNDDGKTESKKYVGEFEDGWRKGKGIETFFSTCSDCPISYVGEFAKNSRDGQGKMIWRNGDFYDGEWSYDKRLGQTGKEYAAAAEAERLHSEQTENCQHIYTGKHITLRHDMAFFGKTSYIVDGFSPEQGLATIRARFDDSRVREVRCNQID